MASSFTERMIGAASLNVATYEELERDTTATGQAAMVVVIAAVASAIGGLRGGGTGMVVALVSALVGWLIWAGVTYFVGTRLFKGTATWGEMLRTLGFAQSPGVLNVLAILPLLGWLVRLIVAIWILIAGIIAIRTALNVDTGRAVLTVLVGWVVYIVFGVLLAIFGLGVGARPF